MMTIEKISTFREKIQNAILITPSSGNFHHERLTVTKNKSEIVFKAKVDGVIQIWHAELKEFVQALGAL